jgi:hypothetical protein
VTYEAHSLAVMRAVAMGRPQKREHPWQFFGVLEIAHALQRRRPRLDARK